MLILKALLFILLGFSIIFFCGLLIVLIEDIVFGSTRTQMTPHYSPSWRRQISHEGLLTGTITWFLCMKEKK